MYIKSQTFLILGIQRSGMSVAEYIIKAGGKCYYYEDVVNFKTEENAKRLDEMSAVRVNKENVDTVLDEIDVLIISPGVPINHEVAVKAKGKNKRIIGELEFGFSQFTPPTVAVTGTNGKTTTVSLIDSILETAGIKKQTVGNIGIPVSSKINETDKDTVCITEVSSFQLESVADFKPHIACVLNISPDHLERHYTMDNYIFLKKRLLKNLKESEYAVLNYDDLTVKSFGEKVPFKVVYVSGSKIEKGAFRDNGKLYYDGEYIINESEIPIKGEHNVMNVLFSIAVAKLLKIESEHIANGIKNFKGIPHRIQFIAEKKGVKYVNDSKATNTGSTITALSAVEGEKILILGGSEKGENYDELFNAIKSHKIKHVVITGASRFNMLASANKTGYTDTTVTADFYKAVKIASLYAEEGDSVLLSPACASFDNFGGYAERGEKFIKTVEELS